MQSSMSIDRAIQIFEEAKRPFSGKLIAPPGESVGCPYCAQGLVLNGCGVDDSTLRKMEQSIADQTVAKILNISLVESIILRRVNDSKKGCPQNILRLTDDGIGSIIGPHWKQLVSYWRLVSVLGLGLESESGSVSVLVSDWGSDYVLALRLMAVSIDTAWKFYYSVSEILSQNHLKPDYDFKFLKSFGFNSPKDIPLLPELK